MHYQVSGNKYRAHSNVYNGIAYHSKLEAAYAVDLDAKKAAGDIKKWERQVKLDLRVNGFHIANYYIDFVVTVNEHTKQYIECKGLETEVWQMKWRVLEATFEQFREHPDDVLIVVKQSSMRFGY